MEHKETGLVAKLKKHGVALAAVGVLSTGCVDGGNIVLQYDNSNQVLNCWRVEGHVWSEGNGVYWNEGSAHGSIASMGVKDGQWEETARALGIDLERCIGGRYQRE